MKIIFIFFIFCNSVFAQTTWFSLTSGTTRNLNSILFTNSTTGYTVGEFGVILKTTNSGINWIAQTGGTFGNQGLLTSIFFLNDNTGYISGGTDYANNGVVMKTTNGGINWISNNYISSHAIRSIFFTSSTIGYAVGVFTINKTINSGNTWSSVFPPTENIFHDVYFTNMNTGYAVGYINGSSGIIYKSTNAGINWNFLPSLPFNHNTSVQFVNESTGYVSCHGGKIQKTTNYGSNWNTLSVLGTSDSFNSLHFISENSGFAVGSGSTIIKTTDGGTN